MFPPGRERPATKPLPTGSATRVKMIGIAVVSRCNSAKAVLDATTTTSGVERTNSAAEAFTRSAVGTGLVPSLARPDGNLTGLSSVAPDLEGKRLELLREIVPSVSHIAVFFNSTSRRCGRR
jgi:ABC-type uncharacterized transport system substrate-binding protein